MGVNGIRTFEKKLYSINSGQETYGRLPLHDDASAAGEVELLARQKVGIWDGLTQTGRVMPGLRLIGAT